jgi:hypothetical protein
MSENIGVWSVNRWKSERRSPAVVVAGRWWWEQRVLRRVIEAERVDVLVSVGNFVSVAITGGADPLQSKRSQLLARVSGGSGAACASGAMWLGQVASNRWLASSVDS